MSGMLRLIIGFVVGSAGTICACSFGDAISHWLNGDMSFSDAFGQGLDRMLTYLSESIEDPQNLANLCPEVGGGMILIGAILLLFLFMLGVINAKDDAGVDEGTEEDSEYIENPWAGIPMTDYSFDTNRDYLTSHYQDWYIKRETYHDED